MCIVHTYATPAVDLVHVVISPLFNGQNTQKLMYSCVIVVHTHTQIYTHMHTLPRSMLISLLGMLS